MMSFCIVFFVVNMAMLLFCRSVAAGFHKNYAQRRAVLHAKDQHKLFNAFFPVLSERRILLTVVVIGSLNAVTAVVIGCLL